MYKKRNILFGILWSIITIIIFKLLNWLNVVSTISVLIFWLGPSLFSSKFNDS
jgi:hypothetical protein